MRGMRVARGSASLLSSHGRGIAPQDALKKDSRGLLRVGAGNPNFHKISLVHFLRHSSHHIHLLKKIWNLASYKRSIIDPYIPSSHHIY